MKNRDIERTRVPSDPFPASVLPKFVDVVPVKDIKIIDITFPFPEVESLYASKPTRYLTHLLGHESDGSVLAGMMFLFV